MTKKRLANQYSGGNLITQREADRINNYIRHLNKMVDDRNLWTSIDVDLMVAVRALRRALEKSDREHK